MSLSIATMVKDGDDYMKTWPLKKELYSMFPECRVINATKFAIKVLPALGIFTIIFYYSIARNNLAWASFKSRVTSESACLVQ